MKSIPDKIRRFSAVALSNEHIAARLCFTGHWRSLEFSYSTRSVFWRPTIRRLPKKPQHSQEYTHRSPWLARLERIARKKAAARSSRISSDRPRTCDLSLCSFTDEVGGRLAGRKGRPAGYPQAQGLWASSGTVGHLQSLQAQRERSRHPDRLGEYRRDGSRGYRPGPGFFPA